MSSSIEQHANDGLKDSAGSHDFHVGKAYRYACCPSGVVFFVNGEAKQHAATTKTK